jgi:hypothetical protein
MLGQFSTADKKGMAWILAAPAKPSEHISNIVSNVQKATNESRCKHKMESVCIRAIPALICG